jgi:hypothetical protein
MPADKETQQDIQEIKQMLTALHLNMQQILNQNANINNQAVLAGIKRDYTNLIVNHVNNDINDSLENHMCVSAPAGIRTRVADSKGRHT